MTVILYAKQKDISWIHCFTHFVILKRQFMEKLFLIKGNLFEIVTCTNDLPLKVTK